MPFTPDSMKKAQELDRPHVGEIYDVVVDTSYIPAFHRISIREKRFQVIWPGHNHYYVDPVVELFIPLRKKYRKEYDIHIVLDAVHSESREGLLVYRFCCGTFERKNVDTRLIEAEVDTIAPLILNELDDLFQTWTEADNGLCVYLEEQNVSSIHQFLESIGLRNPDSPNAEQMAAAKERRRQAYLKEHPEHAHTAKRHNPIH